MSTNPIHDVKHVVEASDSSGLEVNDYLAIDGWVLLEVTKQTNEGDAGPYSYPVYSVGWIGNGEPVHPERRRRHST